jgi:acetyl-CoA carboxylase carboxyl transferase subunit alpha
MELGVIDGVIAEPLGGAHHDPQGSADLLKASIVAALEETSKLSTDKLLDQRYEKFRRMGVFAEEA